MMLATRAVLLVITACVWLLNGWGVLQMAGVLPVMPGSLIGTLIANMLIVPIVMWSAYRTGQLTEEAYRARVSPRHVRSSDRG